MNLKINGKLLLMVTPLVILVVSCSNPNLSINLKNVIKTQAYISLKDSLSAEDKKGIENFSWGSDINTAEQQQIMNQVNNAVTEENGCLSFSNNIPCVGRPKKIGTENYICFDLRCLQAFIIVEEGCEMGTCDQNFLNRFSPWINPTPWRNQPIQIEGIPENTTITGVNIIDGNSNKKWPLSKGEKHTFRMAPNNDFSLEAGNTAIIEMNFDQNGETSTIRLDLGNN